MNTLAKIIKEIIMWICAIFIILLMVFVLMFVVLPVCGLGALLQGDDY